jgi:hypothetical protein
LGPGEAMEYTIKVKDVWRIPDIELDVLEKHTDNIMLLLKDTEYYTKAKSTADKIYAGIDGIIKSQGAKVPAAEHIAYYRDNTQALQLAKRDVSELEKLVTQRGVTAGVTVRWPDEQGGGTQLKKQRGYEGLDMIAESIFKGKAPTIATTWKIIFAIIGFMGTIAAFFFALWYIQSKKKAKK